jgi:hypothetical protein
LGSWLMAKNKTKIHCKLSIFGKIVVPFIHPRGRCWIIR